METFTGIFDQVKTEVGAQLSLSQMFAMLPRLLAAVAIGTVLSLRPWRALLKRPLPASAMVHAQILLCAAAAVITAVIGDSLAKAFGLVGLGGFVRFRSGLKDPRDAAIFFLMIGLGMACGHGSLGLAAVGTIFVSVLLLALDVLQKDAPETSNRGVLTAEADDVMAAETQLRRVLGARNVMVTRSAVDLDGRKLELEFEEKQPGGFSAALSAQDAPALRAMRWNTLPLKPAKDRTEPMPREAE